MREQEWLASKNPLAMLQWVTESIRRTSDGRGWQYVAPQEERNPNHPSNRKLRLFACAACRSVWHLLTDLRCRKIIEAAERYADDPSAVITSFHDDAGDVFDEMYDSS